jgi:hypothetical protein
LPSGFIGVAGGLLGVGRESEYGSEAARELGLQAEAAYRHNACGRDIMGSEMYQRGPFGISIIKQAFANRGGGLCEVCNPWNPPGHSSPARLASSTLPWLNSKPTFDDVQLHPGCVLWAKILSPKGMDIVFPVCYVRAVCVDMQGPQVRGQQGGHTRREVAAGGVLHWG